MIKLSKSIKNLAIFLSISLYTIIYIIWYLNINLSIIGNYAKVLFPWIVAAMVIQLTCFLWIKKVTMFDIGLWFLVLSYFFMYGYIFIGYFNLETTLLWAPIKGYNHSTLFQANFYVNLSLNMFSLGYLLNYKVDKERGSKNYFREGVSRRNFDEVYDKRKYKIGIILCIIGGVCQFISSWTLVKVTQNAGSYTAYTQAASSGIIDDIAFLFVPGVIYILSSRNLTNTKAFIFTGIVIAYFSLIMLLSGSRKTQIFGIVAVLLAYLHKYKPPKLKFYHKAFMVLGSVLFLNMIYVIRENRVNLSQMIPIFIESLKSLDFLKILLPEILAETGLTFCSVASVVYCVPSVFSFEYGMTLLRSTVSILPIGWLFPDFFKKATTTMTINKYMNLPVGGSMFADFYWNWGYFGIFAAFIFGMLLSICFTKLSRKFSEIYFSLFYILLMSVRAGVFELVRPVFIIIFIPWLIKSIIIQRKI